MLKKINDFTILEVLGEGAWGTVYHARDTRPIGWGEVAIKMIPEDRSRNWEAVQRFEQEADCLSKLKHNNVVRFYEFGKDRETGRRFIVMEYVNGGTLAARLEQRGCPLRDAKQLRSLVTSQGVFMLHMSVRRFECCIEILNPATS